MDTHHRQEHGLPPPIQPSPPPPAVAFNSLLPFAVIVITAFSLISSMSSDHNIRSILHQVREGHVGVYSSGGALLKNINDPGFHWKLPLVIDYEHIQVTHQIDQVQDIPCGTNGGVMIYFNRIEARLGDLNA